MISNFLIEFRFHYWVFLLVLTSVVATVHSCIDTQPAPTVLHREITKEKQIIARQHNAASLASSQELQCLVHALWHEARGEGEEGMAAVAAIIKNRVDSRKYPDTYCKVIQQPKQFSYRNHLPQGELLPIKIQNTIDKNTLLVAKVVAKKTIQGKIQVDIPSSALYYARHDVKNYWTKKKTVVAQVGKHVFYN